MGSLSIRIDLADGRRIGPGKIRLLEAIGRSGSISAGGRELGMSYRRAWLLVSELNTIFKQPVVEAIVGGRQGGGATLTPFGERLITTYREVERLSHVACEEALQSLDSAAA